MANGNSKMLTAEQKMQLRQPIDDYVGKIQRQIDDLREDGTEKVVSIQNTIDGIKRNRALSKAEKDSSIAKAQAELEKAKAVEAKNKDEISKLISQAESYLKEHFDKDYYQPIKESSVLEKAAAKEKYSKRIAQLEKEHQAIVSKLTDHQEIKDENYVYKNRQFDAKMELEQDFQEIKDRKHEAFAHKYHLIDLLRMSKFTFASLTVSVSQMRSRMRR